MIPDQLLADAEALLDACRVRGVKLATAESCTGGLIAAVLTAIAGSSEVVDRGYVTYSNAAKTAMLGVPAALIATHGAVSAPVAEAMAVGALGSGEASGGWAGAAPAMAVAVTGIAGPGGGSADKPVGLVWFGLAHGAPHGATVWSGSVVFPGDRTAVRVATVRHAIGLLRARL